MTRLMKRARRLLAAAGFVFFPALALAAGSGTQAQRQQQPPPKPAAMANPMDVEELNDTIAQQTGKKVTVAGEIEEWLDARSFVLESGGLFNDEIAVIVPPDVKGLDTQRLNEDADIVVSGTVRAMRVVDVERELGWDLQPELEVELEGVKHFLVAERITRQRD